MRRHIRMKGVAALLIAGCVWAGIVVAQSALAGLGLNDAAGRQIVDDWVGSGYINVAPGAKAFKAAALTSRATLVTNAMAWARTYTESAGFKASYEKRRQAERPESPDAKGTVDDELARQRAERQKAIDEMKKGLAGLPAETRAAMEAAIKEMEANNRKIDKDPEMVAMNRQMIEAQHAEETKTQAKRVAAFEQNWPADPKVLIKRRLQAFLDVSQDVDFDAKLVQAGSKKRFANPAYEEKPAEWKLCYRAGRDAVAAAREAAQAWLKSL